MEKPEKVEKRSLYEISAELDRILSAMNESAYDEESVNAAVDAWLEISQEEISQKVDDYCRAIANRLSMAGARRQEAKALSDMAGSDERIADKLKERLKGFFERVGIERMETVHFKPRLQNNGGVTPVILTEGKRPEDLPEFYQKVTVEADTDKIREALERGVELDFAKLAERGRHLRLR